MAQEVQAIHTRLLRMGLAADESRAWWIHVDPQDTADQTLQRAFEERWFGSRSMTRVRYLANNLKHRFNAFPEALDVLKQWRPADLADRRIVCHWHLQLTDPLYREFTGAYLEQQRQHPEPTVDKTAVSRWLDHRLGARWAPATSLRMANGLLAAATEAGLCEGSKPTRPLVVPQVGDRALGYLLYLLRFTTYEGTLSRNPYLASVGLRDEALEARLRRTPGLSYRRMAGVRDLDWQFPNLKSWAAEVLA